MKKIIVTGGNGFIEVICKISYPKKYFVINIDKNAYSKILYFKRFRKKIIYFIKLI